MKTVIFSTLSVNVHVLAKNFSFVQRLQKESFENYSNYKELTSEENDMLYTNPCNVITQFYHMMEWMS